MKTLLISLQDKREQLGLKCLHYTLLKSGHNSSLLYLPYLDTNKEKTLESIKNFVREINPGLVGISLMSLEYNKARNLTRFLKESFKSTPIIWGGVHPTILPEMCLDYADYVCIGEGERTIIDLANAIGHSEDIRSIRNLCYRTNGQIKRNPLYPLNDNLDGIPPYDHLPINCSILKNDLIMPLDKNLFKSFSIFQGRTYSIMSSRGCPFSCAYCTNNFYSRLYQTKKVRRRSVLNIIAELKTAIKDNPEIEYINFEDDSFPSCSTEYLRQFCEMYKEHIRKPLIVHCIPIYLKKNKLEMLKDAGLVWINLGLESGSDRTLRDVYKRKSLRSDFLKAASFVNKLKIGAMYDVLVDNPFETDEDRIETIKTLVETPKPYMVRIFSLTFLPGTELYERAKRECFELEGEYLIKNFTYLQKKYMNEITKLAATLNKKYINKLIRLYKENSNSIKFKINLFTARLIAAILLRPIYFTRLIKLLYRGSLGKTINTLPKFVIEYSLRHLHFVKTFRGSDVFPF